MELLLSDIIRKSELTLHVTTSPAQRLALGVLDENVPGTNLGRTNL